MLTKIANPGKSASHQAISMKSRDCERISPHDGVGGCTPNPKNDRLDSTKIDDATPKVAETRTGARLFGRMCLKMRRIELAPTVFPAVTKSCPRSFKNSPRTRRAIPGQLVRPMTAMML